jgi:hypothetical protein
MNSLRFLLAPIFAFFDLSIYREARGVKTGAAVLFVAYLSLLFCMALAILGLTQMSVADDFVSWLKKDLPSFTISQTGLKIDQPGRYEIRHPQLGLLAILDDTKEIVSPDEAGKVPLYVTSKFIYINKNGKVESSQIGSQAKKDFSAHVDSALIDRLYKKIKMPLIIFGLVLLFIMGFLTRLLAALFFSSVGLLIQLVLPRNLTFSQLFSMASFVIAVSLPFNLLQYIPQLTKIFSGPAGALIAFVYMVLAISSQPRVTPKE